MYGGISASGCAGGTCCGMIMRSRKASGEAIQATIVALDCFVASLLAMTEII